MDSSLTYTTFHNDTTYFIHYSTIFEAVDSSRKYLRCGERSAPAVADLNNDGYIDMIVGNLSGGLTFYKGTTPPPHDIGYNDIIIPDLKLKLFPNPVKENITIQISEILINTEVNIQIYDIIGNLVLEKSMKNTKQTSINVSKMANGIYICRVSSLSNTKKSYNSSTKKFIVNH